MVLALAVPLRDPRMASGLTEQHQDSRADTGTPGSAPGLALPRGSRSCTRTPGLAPGLARTQGSQSLMGTLGLARGWLSRAPGLAPGPAVPWGSWSSTGAGHARGSRTGMGTHHARVSWIGIGVSCAEGLPEPHQGSRSGTRTLGRIGDWPCAGLLSRHRC